MTASPSPTRYRPAPRRWIVAALLAVLGVVAAAWASPRITRVSAAGTLGLGSEGAAARFDEFTRSFGTDDLILFSLRAPDPESLFTSATLDFLSKLETTMRRQPGVEGVIAVTNIKDFAIKRRLGLQVPAAPKPLVPRTEGELARSVRDKLRNDPFLTRGLVSKDGCGFACWVQLEVGLRDREDYLDLVQDIVAAAPQPEDSTLRVSATALPLVRKTLQDLLWGDGLRLGLAALFGVGVVALLGGIPHACVGAFALAWPMITGVLALWFAISGRPLHGLSNNLLPLLVIVSAATMVHLGWSLRRGAGVEPYRAVLISCLLTTLTTAAGFAGLLASSVQALRWLGTEAIVGCAVALAITSTLLRWLRPAREEVDPVQGKAPAAGLRPRWLVIVPLAVLGLPWFALAPERMPRVGDFLEYLPDDVPVVAQAKDVIETVGALGTCELVVRLDEDVALKRLGDPAFHLELAALQDAVIERSEGSIPFVLSPVTLLAYLNLRLEAAEGRTGNEHYRVTEGAAKFAIRWLITPYLTLLGAGKVDETKLPPLMAALKNRMKHLLTSDGTMLRFNCRLADVSSDRVLALRSTFQRSLFSEFTERLGAREIFLTGQSILAAETAASVVDSQVASLLAGGLFLMLILLLALRSVRLWSLSLVTNLFTVTGTITLLWIFRADLNLYTTVLSATLLGVLVDDSVHYLLCLKRLMPATASPEQAAIDRVGPPIRLSSIALGVGFLSFLLSPLPPYRQFALTAVATISLALYWDLVALPALAALVRRRSRDAAAPPGDGSPA